MCPRTAWHLLVSHKELFLSASISPRISPWPVSPMRCYQKRSGVHGDFSGRQVGKLEVLGQVRGAVDTAPSTILMELHRTC